MAPVGTITPTLDEDISFFFLYVLLLTENPPNLVDIQEQCICKLGNIQSELNLLFGIYY